MSATSPSVLRPLPTDEKLGEAERLLGVAHDEYEAIVRDFTRFAYSFELDRIIPDVLPTYEDVGRFFAFAHYLELRSQELHSMADQMMGALPALGEMSANVKLAEEDGKRCLIETS